MSEIYRSLKTDCDYFWLVFCSYETNRCFFLSFNPIRHMLAQQRLEESDGTQISESNTFCWRSDIGSSDQNLYKKRDFGIRKSTLLRRLWGNNKSLSEKRTRLVGGHYDWQYSSIKVLTEKQSQNSAQSSPEHKKLVNRRTFADDTRTSPIRYNKNTSKYHFDENNPSSPKKQLNKNIDFINQKLMSHQINNKYTNTPRLQAEFECERLSTRSTDDTTSTTSYATFSDNYDSTFTYSKVSNTTTTSTCDTCENNNKVVQHKVNEVNRKIIDDKKSTIDDGKYERYAAVNESTQTSDITNLNIISNVQLSQSTINTIFSHVLNDLQEDKIKNINDIKTDTNSNNDPANAKLIKVQEVPSFYLKRNDNIEIGNDESRILKYMISNVGTGSNYGKPAEVPQIIVPRYSALPRTSSMEVNTSSGDGTDRESDTLSLVDSLEDPASPRINDKLSIYDKKPVRGDVSPLLLPDNSKKRKRLKPATFYVPIETDAKTEIKPVAEHLPAKVKEKLWKRQMKREEKIAQTKSTFLTSLNNHSVMVITNDRNDNTTTLRQFTDTNSNRTKFKSKPVLPSIDHNYKYKAVRDKIRVQPEEKSKENPNKSVKRKSVFVSQGQLNDSHKYKVKPGSHLRMRHKPEKLTPIYTTRNDFMRETLTKKTCNQNEVDNKRIEILEIVECIQTTAVENTQTLKNKSKIPVLVKPKTVRTQPSQSQHGFIKPCYLDFDQAQTSDPKIDQLIANILIDSLNINQTESSSRSEVTIETKSQSKLSETSTQIKQKFDAIPEESCQNHNSKCSSFEESYENVDDKIQKEGAKQSKGNSEEAAVVANNNENSSTVPKGWVTFYMLHKHQGTPDSTSDEGINISQTHQKF